MCGQLLCRFLILMSLVSSSVWPVTDAAESGVIQVPDGGLNVLVKLSRFICNPKTGQTSQIGLENAIDRAAEKGLAYVGPLEARCWHAFMQAPNKTETTAAINELASPSADDSTNDPSANIAAPFGTETIPFVIAAVDKPLLLPETQAAPPTIQAASATTSAADLSSDLLASNIAGAISGVGGVAGVPAECPGGTCAKTWGINRINVMQLWEQDGIFPAGFTKKGCIIDTGVDYGHADLQGQIDQTNSGTYNRVGNTPAQGATNTGLFKNSSTGHGSHVTGTVAGSWGNGDTRGIAGIPGFAQKALVSCNAFSPGPSFSSSMTTVGAASQDIVSCLRHALSKGAHWVVNLSLGWTGLLRDNQLIVDAVQQSICDNDGIAVIAAGNSAVDITAAGTDSSGRSYDGVYPAALAKTMPDCVLAVAAVDNRDRLADFSNWGQYVTVAAPGVSITSDTATKYADYPAADPWSSATLQGTSMAAPHVTGVLLLLRNAFPAATAAQVLRCLRTTATTKPQRAVADTSGNRVLGGGIVNAVSAYDCLKVQLAYAGGIPSPSPSPSPGGSNVANSPAGGIAPQPEASPVPAASPAPADMVCPNSGLPGCVDAVSGSVVPSTTRCSTRTEYCTSALRSSTGTRYKCRYALKPAGYVCSPGIGPCQLDAQCTGASSACPRNVSLRRVNGTTCRTSTG